MLNNSQNKSLTAFIHTLTQNYGANKRFTIKVDGHGSFVDPAIHARWVTWQQATAYQLSRDLVLKRSVIAKDVIGGLLNLKIDITLTYAVKGVDLFRLYDLAYEAGIQKFAVKSTPEGNTSAQLAEELFKSYEKIRTLQREIDDTKKYSLERANDIQRMKMEIMQLKNALAARDGTIRKLKETLVETRIESGHQSSFDKSLDAAEAKMKNANMRKSFYDAITGAFNKKD